jgi:acyl-CoA synthetase (AMP-forming)/AMP-acid ligase II
VPSEEWGEDVVAWIVPLPGSPTPNVEDIRAFASTNLAAHKLPRRVVVVDALPRNVLGKVLRHELREAVAHG